MKSKKFQIGHRVYINLHGVDATVIGYKPGDCYVVKTDFPVLVGPVYFSRFNCYGWELSAPCAVENQRKAS